MLKSDATLLIRQLADDPSAKRWTASNLALLATLTLDRLWGEIYEVAPYFNSFLETVVCRADGYVAARQVGQGYLFTDADEPGIEEILGVGPYDTLALMMAGEGYATQVELYADLVASDPDATALLDGAGGQLTQRFYKVQSATIDGVTYGKSTQKEVVEAAADTGRTGDPYTYALIGGRLYFYGMTGEAVEEATSVALRYSYLPTSWSALDDTEQVPWIDGFDMVYVNEVAGRMLTKGAAEDPRMLLSLAKDDMDALKAKVKNESVGSTVIQAHDDPVEWGSTE